MGISRTTTERQLKLAKDDLAGVASRLSQQGVAEGDLAKSPAWRSAEAKVRQIESRIRTISNVEARDAEAARVKEEKLAAPKVKKEKAPKAVKKEKEVKGAAPTDKAGKPKKEKAGK